MNLWYPHHHPLWCVCEQGLPSVDSTLSWWGFGGVSSKAGFLNSQPLWINKWRGKSGQIVDRLEGGVPSRLLDHPQAAASSGFDFPFTFWGQMTPAWYCGIAHGSEHKMIFIFIGTEPGAKWASAFHRFLFTKGKMEALKVKCLSG